MSFDQLSALESGRPTYSDDPGFQQLLSELRNKVFALQRNISQLRTDINLLGTRRDTGRVRERVHGLLDKSRELCKDVGEGVKQLQTWEDLSVRKTPSIYPRGR
jgi:syntaxin 7